MKKGEIHASWFISFAYSPGLLVPLAVQAMTVKPVCYFDCADRSYFSDLCSGAYWSPESYKHRIIGPYQRKTLDQYGDLFKAYDMKVVRSVQHKTEHRISGRWILMGSAENHKKLTAYLLNDSNIQELSF